MQFKEEFISKIISGEKTQTRRLVKEGEIAVVERIENPSLTWTETGAYLEGEGILSAVVRNGKTKYKVGKDYAVQTGRGTKGLWYCPKCKVENCYTGNLKKDFDWAEKGHRLIPLRIKITDIIKTFLRDISNNSVIAEGFKTKKEFLTYFYTLYWNAVRENGITGKMEPVIPKKFKKGFTPETCIWNPEVWVLTFEVKK